MTQKNTTYTKRGNRVFKKTPTSRRWMFMKQVNGKRFYFPLSPVLSDSKTMADEIDAHCLVHPIENVVAQFRPNGRKVLGERKTVPMLTDIMDRYKSLAPTDIGVTSETVKSYLVAIKSIMVKGTGKRLDTICLSDLNDLVISEYKKQRLEGVVGEEKIKSAKRSINSQIQCAKSLFSKDALKMYPDWDISKSEVLLNATKFKRVKKVYRLPAPSLVSKTFALLDSYEDVEPDRFIALALALHFGLRRNEILNSRRDWVNLNKKGLSQVSVYTERDFLVKSGEDGDASGSTAIASKILEQSKSFDYLLSTRSPRTAFDPLLKDLRAIGWDREKPMHECRKLYGSYLASTESLYYAQKNLRHASAMTTNDFYTDLMDDSSIINLWVA
jgi:integrase